MVKVETRNLDFEDFCGNHLDVVLQNISTITPVEAQHFNDLLKTNPSFFDIVNHFSNYSHDQTKNLNFMQDMVLLAFHQKLLTRQQAAAFLEYASMKLDFSSVRIFDVFLHDGKISNEFLLLLAQFADSKSKEKLIASLKGKKNFECCFFGIDIDKDKILDPKIDGTLQVANKLKIVHYTTTMIPRLDLPENEEREPASIYNVRSFNTIMRDLLTQAIYGEHAKNLYTRLGIFSVDDIERSVKKFGRYSAIDYYAVPCAKEFHGVKAQAFFNTLHDELHRRLISTIPNPVFSAYLHMVDVVREKSGLKPAIKDGHPISQGVFSTEIWDGFDMECGLFVNDARNNEERKNNVTKDLIKMMHADVYTENRPVGLCPSSPYIDTTWLVMIDMVLNKDIWQKYLIDASQISADPLYGELYQFVVTHQEILRHEASPIKQIAKIKALWFGMTYDEKKLLGFRRRENLIELSYDKNAMNPTLCSKKIALKMLNLSIKDFQDDDFRLQHSDLFNEFVNRLAKDGKFFYGNIHTRDQFDFIMSHVQDPVLVDSLNYFINYKIDICLKEGNYFLEKKDYNEATAKLSNVLNLIGNYDYLKKSEVQRLIAISAKENMDELKRKKNDFSSNAEPQNKLIISDDSSSEEEINFDFNTKQFERNVIKFGAIALHVFAFNGEEGDVIKLLNDGYDPMIEDDQGNIPIELAIDNNHFSIINELFSRMESQSPVIRKDLLDRLLKRALYNTISYPSSLPQLHIYNDSDGSIVRTRFDILKYFIVKGADMNLKIDGGWTPLLIAVRSNISHLIIHLLSLSNPSVDINHTLDDGWTALHIAVQNLYPDLVIFLLNRGASTTIKNSTGDIPIVLALRSGNTEMFNILFKHMLVSGQFKNKWIIQSLTSEIKKMKIVPEVVINLMKQFSDHGHSQQKLFHEQKNPLSAPKNPVEKPTLTRDPSSKKTSS